MWVILALGSGLFQTLRNMLMKQIGHSLDETINVWGRFAFLVPFAAVATIWNGQPEIREGFWSACILVGFTQTIAVLALSRALKLSDLSMVTPLWKLSLIVLVIWGYIALGEQPSLGGVAGVLVSLAGVYMINMGRTRTAWWAPFAAAVTDPGQRWTLLSAVFYALGVVYMKRLVLASDPYFGAFMAYVSATAVITPYAIWRSGHHFKRVLKLWKEFVMLGAFAAVSIMMGAVAYTLTLSSYVEAVKQVEILFALMIGYVVFHERARVRAIWPGALAILVGAIMIRLWG
jgi:drug/metabolite transporter (DMT)-like permease